MDAPTDYWHAIDDRGQVIKPLSPSALRRASGGADARTRATVASAIRAVIRAEGASDGCRAVCFHIIAGVVAIIGGFGCASLQLAAMPSAALTVGAYLLAYSGLGIVALRTTRGPAIARTIVAHGLCPACAYSFHGLPPAPDGCVACPECGGAWDAERLTRAHWRPRLAPLCPRRTLVQRVALTHPCVLEDARGTIARSMDRALRNIDPVHRAARSSDEWRDIRRALRPGDAIQRWLLAALLALIGAAIAYAAVRLDLLDGWPWLSVEAVGSAVGVLAFLCAAAVTVLHEKASGPAESIALFLGVDTCPVCAGELVLREASKGGLLCCDGCGCAWKPVAAVARV